MTPALLARCPWGSAVSCMKLFYCITCLFLWISSLLAVSGMGREVPSQQRCWAFRVQREAGTDPRALAERASRAGRWSCLSGLWGWGSSAVFLCWLELKAACKSLALYLRLGPRVDGTYWDQSPVVWTGPSPSPCCVRPEILSQMCSSGEVQ